MNVYVDVETIPSQSPEALAEVRANLKPPGTLKKPETIAAWWKDEADAAAQEAWRKQALDGGTCGEIISIACVTDGDYGSEWVMCRSQRETEAQLLQCFADHVQDLLDNAAQTGPDGRAWPVGEVYPVAHNAAFDVPYIWRRCIVNSVRLPFRWPGPMARAGKDYGCTMQTWAGFGGRVSLDTLCKALGIASPKGEGMDGSQVFDRWAGGDWAGIAAISDYNLRDAQATREIWHRLHGRVAA